MKRSQRYTISFFALLALACAIAAIWFPENGWRFVASGVIFFVVAIILLAITDPDFGKK